MLRTCPIYTVRIYADGKVAWFGQWYVAATGERTRKIEATAARKLVEQFREPRFWALCSSYSCLVTDMPTYTTTARFGSDQKTLANYAQGAPAWVWELENQIDAVAETKEWIGRWKF